MNHAVYLLMMIMACLSLKFYSQFDPNGRL